MNWSKCFTGTPDHEEYANGETTETENDEDVTDSTGTVSTDKGSNFLGMHFHKFSHNHLSQRCIKLVFLTINVAIFVSINHDIIDNELSKDVYKRKFYQTFIVYSL